MSAQRPVLCNYNSKISFSERIELVLLSNGLSRHAQDSVISVSVSKIIAGAQIIRHRQSLPTYSPSVFFVCIDGISADNDTADADEWE